MRLLARHVLARFEGPDEVEGVVRERKVQRVSHLRAPAASAQVAARQQRRQIWSRAAADLERRDVAEARGGGALARVRALHWAQRHT